MKRFAYILALSLIVLFAFSCKTKYIEVPIEKIKVEKEYIDRIYKDSIHIHDSIFLAYKGDTVFLEKYKMIYRDKLIRDSVFVTDSISVDKPVYVDKLVPYYPKWMIILAIFGSVGITYLLIKLYIRIRKLF